MVSNNRLFLSVPGFFCTSLSQYLITFWSQISSVFSPGTLTQSAPADCLLSCPCPVSSTSTAASSRSLQHWWTWLQSENLAEVGLSFGLNLGPMFFFCLVVTQTMLYLCYVWFPKLYSEGSEKKRSNFKGLFTHAVKRSSVATSDKWSIYFCCLVSQMTRCGYIMNYPPRQ